MSRILLFTQLRTDNIIHIDNTIHNESLRVKLGKKGTLYEQVIIMGLHS